ncbi:hypothetical protein RIF29_29108 [Crotalaria pallida]|uniref:Uncharacterized protein n=1 Tax=Crotalaria pallida TaxID=3830 RepID=A0AAN9EJ51_CROPI
MHVVADTGQSLECISIERSSSGKLRLECSEGTAEADLGKINAKLQYIEQMLQKVKHEEKLRLSCGDSQFSADKFPGLDGKIQPDAPYKEIPSIASSLNYTHSNRSGSIDQCSRPSSGVMESGSSASAVYSKLKRDFSMFEGEICLDKLSIRELHELFKVTFGRETTVKDKQWLKRRIAMSFTNSCDISATTFIVKDNKIVRKCEKDSSGNGNAVAAISMENMAADGGVNFKDSPAAEGSGIEDNQVVSETRLRNPNTEHELGGEDHQMEQKAMKRMRKPTKRYIEELSENESREHSPRLLSSNKNTGLGYTKPARNASSEVRTFVTRLDMLGGYGVQIPCVSRVRRSRPRKHMASLMKYHPTGMGKAPKLGNKALGEHGLHGSNSDNESPEKVLKLRSMPGKFHQPSASEPVKERCPVIDTIELRQELPKKTDPSSCTSDGNISTVPTAKGGMRRKHHRAWTLVEVMKLVEGVSRCGAGRWSEIKRLSFSSYSYRTSVDLKDKWRNLLKASYAPADDGMNSRKHGAVPIPEHILLRVRELAEMNSQVPPNFSSSKLTTAGAGSVHVDRSGFL